MTNWNLIIQIRYNVANVTGDLTDNTKLDNRQYVSFKRKQDLLLFLFPTYKLNFINKQMFIYIFK